MWQTILKKGSLAGVDGRVQTRNYEGQDGKRVYVTEILAESVQFLEPRSSSAGERNEGGSYGNQRSYNGGNDNSNSNYDNPFGQNSNQNQRKQ